MGPRKNDIIDRKSRVDLIPSWILLDIGYVMGHGGIKYKEYNYRTYPGLKFSTMSAAAKRHQFEFDGGRNIDDETGKHPLVHTICEDIMILDSIMYGYPGQDDRIKKRL